MAKIGPMAEDCEEIEDDTPNIVSGEVVHSENGDISYRVLRKIGEGRCCVVYSGEATRDASLVALKFFRKGSNYEGALQREQYILDNFHDPSCNIVCCYGYLIYKGLHCLIQELLECNVRQIIFRNDRQGLSPWGTLKFARDVLTALNALHQSGLVHADLKPANIMWSSQDGCFKCLDFGLTFHIEEEDLHQIQSTGYRAPEATAWNKYKEDQKIKRKRKLQGTYLQLNYLVTPTCKDSLNLITELPEEKLSLEFASDDHPDSTRRYDPDDPPTLTRCKGSLTNPKLVRHDENEKNDQLVHSNGELSSKYGEKDQQNCVASRENENDDDGDSDSDNNIGNDNDYNMARADANQHTSKNLYRCDSESSGVFSQGSSDRSQCPSRLSCDVETMLEAAAHHECRIAAQHRLPMVEDDLTEDDQNCDKDLESSRLCAEGNPSSISEHVVMSRRNGGGRRGSHGEGEKRGKIIRRKKKCRTIGGGDERGKTIRRKKKYRTYRNGGKLEGDQKHTRQFKGSPPPPPPPVLVWTCGRLVVFSQRPSPAGNSSEQEINSQTYFGLFSCWR